MSQSILVLGYGAVGRAVTAALLARGDAVRVVQRKRPADLPAQATFQSCDVVDAASVRKAVEGASQAVLCVGFPYDAKLWRKVWPATITNVVEACAATGARIVFLDNLYQLGPQREARREDMALTSRGNKPAILAEVTRIWSAAAVAGRVRMAALRAADFYGPGVTLSHLGPAAFGAIAKGAPATMLAPPDTPHDFAYVPDIARAIVTLLDAPDDAFGQIWNMPCAPVTTPRAILQMGADALGKKLKVRTVPRWSWPVIGLFWKFLREVSDVGFTWDRPYEVDSTKFKTRFWSDVTPYETGAAVTARWFAENPA